MLHHKRIIRESQLVSSLVANRAMKTTVWSLRGQLTWLKRVGLIAVSVALIALLELVVRLFPGLIPTQSTQDPFLGFSSINPTFVPYLDDSGNSRLKTAELKTKWFNLQDFSREKAPNTFRIFTLGGSTTYGHPYTHLTSFSGWLEKLLNLSGETGKDFEVINAGGISYASYRVAVVLDEVLQYQPDLIVVYTGHNEFLESRTYPDFSDRPAALYKLQASLRKLGIYRLLLSWREWVSSTGENAKSGMQPGGILSEEVETMLDKSAGLEFYQRDSVFFGQVLRHFRYNVERMISACRMAGIPVLFCEPVENIKDFSPFKSMPSAKLSVEERYVVQRLVAEGESLLESSSPQMAIVKLEQALEIDRSGAEVHFYLGRALLETGDTVRAGREFVAARELDICPLRAPEPIHRILQETTARENVDLLALPDLFKLRSAGGLIGNELLLDHIHPSPEGNLLIARQIALWIERQQFIEGFETAGNQDIEKLYTEEMSRLDADYFSTGLLNLAKVLVWSKKIREAYSILSANPGIVERIGEARYLMGAIQEQLGDREKAIHYYRAALQLMPDHKNSMTFLAGLYETTGRFAEAESTYQNALESYPHDIYLLCNFAIMLAHQRRFGEATQYFSRALSRAPQSPTVNNNFGLLYLLKKDFPEAIGFFKNTLAIDSRNQKAHNLLGLTYLLIDKPVEAEKHLTEAMRLNPEDASSRANLGHLYRQTGRMSQAEEQYRLTLFFDQSKPDNFLNLALIYRDMGNKESAVKAALAGLERFPEDQQLVRLRLSLDGK